MRRLLIGFFAIVGFFTVLLIGGVALLVAGLKPQVTPLADHIILNVDLTQGLAEGSHGDRLLRLLVGAEPTLRDVLDGIETAAGDPRVQVLLARVGDDELGLGKIQELPFALRANSPWPTPTVLASSVRGRGPTISRPRSTRSGCSRWAMSG
jgi:hypothetical protein